MGRQIHCNPASSRRPRHNSGESQNECDWFHFQESVKERPVPLAGAGDETGIEVHVVGDVADTAASEGCCASLCSLSF